MFLFKSEDVTGVELPETKADHVNNVTETGVCASLQSLMDGKFDPDVPLDGPVALAIHALSQQIKDQSIRDLERTVKFSIQASEAMEAVSRITCDVRQVGENSQAMASAVEEMAASTDQVANSSSEAAAESNIAQEATRQGIAGIERITASMTHIHEVVHALVSRLNVLEEAAGHIEGMAQSIEDISNQTKLLALNATIEAARAGEAGKGFAVVASEVKALSEQTSQATDHIRMRIGTLDKEMGEMKSAMAESADAVSEGTEIVSEVGKQINEVGEQIFSVNTRMEDIASVLDEQRAATSEISGQVNRIAGRARQAKDNTDAVVEAVSCSEALIEDQFTSLESKTIPNMVLHRAKSDHVLWKKRLAEMMVGLNSLSPDELSDHHSCRLGKWYDQISDPAMRNHPCFAKIAGPHERVHTHGIEAAHAYARGDMDLARDEFERMELESHEVVELLDELIRLDGRWD